MKVTQFIIDNKKLYLEKVLIETKIPLLFICKDKYKNRYTVMCVDTFDIKYIIIQSNIIDLMYFIDGIFTLNTLIEKAKDGLYWEVVTSDENIKYDKIEKKNIVDIPKECLPDNDLIYEENEQRDYYDKLKNEYIYRDYMTTFEKVYFIIMQIIVTLVLSNKYIGLFYNEPHWLISYIISCIILDIIFFRGGKK